MMWKHVLPCVRLATRLMTVSYFLTFMTQKREQNKNLLWLLRNRIRK